MYLNFILLIIITILILFHLYTKPCDRKITYFDKTYDTTKPTYMNTDESTDSLNDIALNMINRNIKNEETDIVMSSWNGSELTQPERDNIGRNIYTNIDITTTPIDLHHGLGNKKDAYRHNFHTLGFNKYKSCESDQLLPNQTLN